MRIPARAVGSTAIDRTIFAQRSIDLCPVSKMSRLSSLRGCMKKLKDALDAYVILTDDAHQSEYIAECDKRRQFISGFTGSAGVAVVTLSEALLWTDGRYHLQASQQLDHNWTLMKQGNEGVPSVEEWLSQSLPSGVRIGFDPQLMSEHVYKKYSDALETSGQVLVGVAHNLVDAVWASERPPRPLNPLLVLSTKFSGRSWQEKLEDVRSEMKKKAAGVLVVTALDEVAWLFNLRGSDISYNPVFFSYAIVMLGEARLYVDESQLSSEVADHLRSQSEDGVQTFPYSTVSTHLCELIQSKEGKIWVDSHSSQALCALVPKARRVKALSPIQLLKGIKNQTEIEGMKNAHIRDGAALCEYLAWLEGEVANSQLDEVTAADKLEQFRQEQPDYVSLSFPTISSSGPNGAVIHYKPEPSTARPLSTQELYLCDSGAQYYDGTTDVTRTVSFGTPSQKQKECFTLVLKGHIALCRAVFPSHTMGNCLDTLARAPLWSTGLDYKHGTGHGVGSFLNVHEGPHGIGRRPYPEPLQANMIVTDEPGYYEDGAFGIRIENVVLVKETETKYNFAGKKYLTMEPVTMAPIQSKMIEPSMLTAEEIDWLNDYHDLVLEKVGDYLASTGKQDVLRWLERETKRLG